MALVFFQCKWVANNPDPYEISSPLKKQTIFKKQTNKKTSMLDRSSYIYLGIPLKGAAGPLLR